MRRIILSLILILASLAAPIAGIFFCRAIVATDGEEFSVVMSVLLAMFLFISGAVVISKKEIDL